MSIKEFILQKETLKLDAVWVKDEWKKIITTSARLAREKVGQRELDRTVLDLSKKLIYLLAKVYIQDKILEELKKISKNA